MKNQTLSINKVYIIEDCEIQSGCNLIAEEDDYTSALNEARQFDSYDEAMQFIQDINPFYNAQVRIVYEVNFGEAVNYFYFEDFKQFLIDFSNEI